MPPSFGLWGFVRYTPTTHMNQRQTPDVVFLRHIEAIPRLAIPLPRRPPSQDAYHTHARGWPKRLPPESTSTPLLQRPQQASTLLLYVAQPHQDAGFFFWASNAAKMTGVCEESIARDALRLCPTMTAVPRPKFLPKPCRLTCSREIELFFLEVLVCCMYCTLMMTSSGHAIVAAAVYPTYPPLSRATTVVTTQSVNQSEA